MYLAYNEGHLYATNTYMDPAVPDTMLTAKEEGQRLTQECGEIITIFINDQQLYLMAVNVTCVYPERFSQFVSSLGGVHIVMSWLCRKHNG